jgi:hypothetical protein
MKLVRYRLKGAGVSAGVVIDDTLSPCPTSTVSHRRHGVTAGRP